MKRIFSGCFLVFLLLLAGGVYVAWRFTSPPNIRTAIPFNQLPKTEKVKRRADAKKLTEEVEIIAKEMRGGERKNFRVEASEDQLNTLLQERIDTSKFPIRNLYVALSPDELALQGQVNYQGFDATATVSGDIQVENGQLVFDAGQLKVQGFSVGSLRRKVEKQVTRALNDWSSKMPGRIESVEIADKKITIEGTTRQ